MNPKSINKIYVRSPRPQFDTEGEYDENEVLNILVYCLKGKIETFISPTTPISDNFPVTERKYSATIYKYSTSEYLRRKSSIINPALQCLQSNETTEDVITKKAKNIIEDRIKLPDFVSYLKDHFQPDILLLWEYIEKFMLYFIHNIYPPHDLPNSIFYFFLEKEAPFSIKHLYKRDREKIRNILSTGKYDCTLFNKIYHKIIRYLEYSELSDFLSSPYYISNYKQKHIISYLSHIPYKFIIQSNEESKLLKSFIIEKYKDDLPLFDFLITSYSYQMNYGSIDTRCEIASKLFQQYLYPKSRISIEMKEEDYSLLKDQIETGSLGRYPFRVCQNIALHLLKKDIDNSFIISKQYIEILSFHYNIPFELVKASLLSQTFNKLDRSIILNETKSDFNNKSDEESYSFYSFPSSDITINIDSSLFASRTNSIHLSTTSNENNNNSKSNSNENEKNKEFVTLEYQDGTKPIFGIQGILTDKETFGLFSSFLFDKYHFNDCSKITEFLRLYNIVDQTSQLTLRSQKLYKAATKYFLESNPFRYFLPTDYSANIVNVLKNNTFENDSLIPINNCLLNILGVYFIPRYEFYQKYIAVLT